MIGLVRRAWPHSGVDRCIYSEQVFSLWQGTCGTRLAVHSLWRRGHELWPISREAFPKQFHKLVGSLRRLFQQTCRRLSGDFSAIRALSQIIAIAFLSPSNSKRLGHAAHYLLEPVGRNTAPAACIAALIATKTDPDALFCLSPRTMSSPRPMRLRGLSHLGSTLQPTGRSSHSELSPTALIRATATLRPSKATYRAQGEAVRGKAIARRGREVHQQWPFLLERRHFPV